MFAVILFVDLVSGELMECVPAGQTPVQRIKDMASLCTAEAMRPWFHFRVHNGMSPSV